MKQNIRHQPAEKSMKQKFFVHRVAETDDLLIYRSASFDSLAKARKRLAKWVGEDFSADVCGSIRIAGHKTVYSNRDKGHILDLVKAGRTDWVSFKATHTDITLSIKEDNAPESRG